MSQVRLRAKMYPYRRGSAGELIQTRHCNVRERCACTVIADVPLVLVQADGGEYRDPVHIDAGAVRGLVNFERLHRRLRTVEPRLLPLTQRMDGDRFAGEIGEIQDVD